MIPDDEKLKRAGHMFVLYSQTFFHKEATLALIHCPTLKYLGIDVSACLLARWVIGGSGGAVFARVHVHLRARACHGV